MKKNSKRLLILCLTIAIFASIGMAGFAYAEEINPPVMITEKAIYSTFEDDVISPWVGADATLSISDDAHSGAKALKAVGSGSATIQATVTEGNGNELFTNAVWHDISFWAKPSTAATLNVYFYIFTSDGDNKQIGLALGDTMPLDYTKYSCGISAIVQEGQLAVRWQRTDMASPTSDKFMTLDQGIVISRIRMDIVASSSELYIDDISMTREVPEPITEIIDKTVFADKFEDGNSDGWEGGQGNANSSHTITDDVKSGSGAVLSTLKTGQTQNRIQTLPIKVGGTSSVQPQQAYYNINFWAKSNADTMLNSMIYINCSDTKSQAITMSSEVLVSSTYANYRGDIAFYVEGGLLKFKWQRFDGGGSSGSLALSPEAEISNIVLVFFTSADKFYIDDFKMSTKVELPRTITKVTKAIDAIGTVTDDSTAAITAANAAYSALDSSLRAQVYNYNELRAANRAFRLLDGVYNANLEFDEQNISLTLGAISDTHNDAPKIAKAMTSLKSFAGGGWT